MSLTRSPVTDLTPKRQRSVHGINREKWPYNTEA
jgi:hypothetical protein